MKGKSGLVFVEIAKIDEEQHIVEGYATTDAVDLDGEIVDLAATRDAIEEYRQWSNVRYMHQAHAVGVVKEMNVDEKGLYVKVKVVDEECWVKVKEGVLKAFSIGFRVLDWVWDAIKEAWRITKYRLIEISLVDRPCNPECAYSVVKRAGAVDDPEVEVSLKFPKASEDAPWDFKESDYTVEQLARASAWIDGVGGDPHTATLPDDLAKKACHLRHHGPDGTLYLSGINAARARLKQTAITDNAKKEADKHLLKHLKADFGRADAKPIMKALISFLRELFAGKGTVSYADVQTEYEAEMQVCEFRERLWECICVLESVIENIFEGEDPNKTALVANAITAFHENVNQLLAEIPTKAAAGTTTQEESEMNDEQVKKLVADEVGKAKGKILTELGGKIDELKKALTPPEAVLVSAAEAGKGTGTPVPEPPAEPAPAGDAGKTVDEQVAELDVRLKGLEAGASKAGKGQDEVPAATDQKWVGVLDNVFH